MSNKGYYQTILIKDTQEPAAKSLDLSIGQGFTCDRAIYYLNLGFSLTAVQVGLNQ